jgi:ubiquinone/menaquinone biosynthesis C-methylase UbiE
MPIWYDIFSLLYDRALEDLYAPFRRTAVEALRLFDGAKVLDLPCGTGQSFDLLAPAVGSTGSVLGIDQSRGMLHKARRRVERAGWDNVKICQASGSDLNADLLARELGESQVDVVLCALGLTALPDWEKDFERMYSRLRPGGRFVIFDVFAAERTRATRSVELVARADLSREVWRPLAARCADFERVVLPADVKKFGGNLFVASGSKPPGTDSSF